MPPPAYALPENRKRFNFCEALCFCIKRKIAYAIPKRKHHIIRC